MTPATALPRVLLVDDDERLLTALERLLRREFAVHLATSPDEGLAALRASDDFAVIVSDLRMPEMDGIMFLTWARELRPKAVRILLSGHADTKGLIGAVNEGHVWRVLTKPVPSAELIEILHEAVAEYRVHETEQAVLEQTLHGVVESFTELLSLVQPAAFGRAMRLRRHVGDLADRVQLPSKWEAEVAAMMSQLGCLTLDAGLVERWYKGGRLDAEDIAEARRLPAIAEGLLAHVPRFKGVVEILRAVPPRPLRPGCTDDVGCAPSAPKGAHMLTIALDFDALFAELGSAADALATMEGRHGWYDPETLGHFHELRGSHSRAEIVEMPLSRVALGMTFAADVVSPNHLLLVARGQKVTSSLLDRVHTHWSAFAEVLTVRVIVAGNPPVTPSPAAQTAPRQRVVELAAPV